MQLYPLPRSRPPGFTLIELLVTIMILVVLAALIFGGLRIGREKVDAATCLNNMRMVGAGVFLYTNDNNGRLPPVDNVMDANGNYIAETSWINVIPHYLGTAVTVNEKIDLTRRVMRCPEMRRVILAGAGVPNEKAITSIHQLRNFAYNFYLGPNRLDANNWRTVGSLRNPSKTMMITESGLSTDFVCVGVIDTGWITQSTRGVDGVLRKGVHGNFNNIFWADGHIAPWEDISRMVRAPYRPGSTDDLWQGR